MTFIGLGQVLGNGARKGLFSARLLAAFLGPALLPAPVRGQNSISTGTKAGFRMYYPGSNDWWLDPSKGNFDIRMNGQPALATLNNQGYLGIGTTSPAQALSIRRTAAAILLANDGGASNDNPSIQWNAVSSLQGLLFKSGGTTVGQMQDNGSFVAQAFGTYSGMNIRSNFSIERGSGNGPIITLGQTTLSPAFVLDSQTDFGSTPLFQLKNAGAVKLSVDSAGSVGIGTTSPAAKLNVGGNILATGDISGATINGGTPLMSPMSSTLSINATPALATNQPGIQVSTNFFVMGGGNVGVGTTAPLFPLSVNGAVTIGTGTFTFPQALNIQGNNLTGNFAVGILMNDFAVPGAAWEIKPQGSNTTKLFRIIDYANNADRLDIDANGNVGIGTPSPGSRLHVVSTGAGGAEVWGEGGYALRWGNTSDLGSLTFSGGDPLVQAISGNLQLYSNNANVLLQPIGGNVGIGTAGPSTTLDVSGDARAASFAANGWNASGLSGVHLFAGVYQSTADIIAYNYPSGPYRDLALQNNAVYIQAAGNVGIGTTNPTFPLHVQQSAANANLARIYNTSASGSVLDLVTTGSGTQQVLTARGNDGNTPALWVLANGNVGVGLAPNGSYIGGRHLEVAGGAVIGASTNGLGSLPNYTDTLLISGIGGANSTAAGIQFGDNASGGSRQWGIYNGQATTGITIGSLNFVLSSAVNGDALGGSTAMTIDSSGRVGIGTTSPAAALEVKGPVQFDSTVNFSMGAACAGTECRVAYSSGTAPSFSVTMASGNTYRLTWNISYTGGTTSNSYPIQCSVNGDAAAAHYLQYGQHYPNGYQINNQQNFAFFALHSCGGGAANSSDLSFGSHFFSSPFGQNELTGTGTWYQSCQTQNATAGGTMSSSLLYKGAAVNGGWTLTCSPVSPLAWQYEVILYQIGK